MDGVAFLRDLQVKSCAAYKNVFYAASNSREDFG